jgi:hypothetical protein
MFERVQRVYQLIYAGGRDDLTEQADALQFKLEVVAEQIAEEQARGNTDPDALLSPTGSLRLVQPRLTQLEKQLEAERHLSPAAIKLKSKMSWINYLVQENGTELDKQTFAGLSTQLERYIEKDDQRGIKFIAEQANTLAGSIVHGQHWYWEGWFATLKRDRRRFVNQVQADNLIKSADAALERKDLPGLRTTVIDLQKLLPADELEKAQEQAMQPGVKRS